MLTSLALIFLLGLLLGYFFNRLKLPSLLLVSADLRKVALIIILIRAGLALDINDLKKVGRPAILLSFIPAVLEISAIAFIAPLILGIGTLEAIIINRTTYYYESLLCFHSS